MTGSSGMRRVEALSVVLKAAAKRESGCACVELVGCCWCGVCWSAQRWRSTRRWRRLRAEERMERGEDAAERFRGKAAVVLEPVCCIAGRVQSREQDTRRRSR